MKIIIVTAILLCFLLSSTTLFVSIFATSTGAGNQNALYVEYTNGSAEPYDVTIDSGDKYTISQKHSWVRDETSRYNLVSYSIDNGEFIDIPRSARGDFTLDIPMDSSHSIEFQAVAQYPISIDGGSNSKLTNLADFSLPSPTHDNWFDLNTEVTISIPYIVETSSGTREQLVSWSVDYSGAKQVVQSNDGPSSIVEKVRIAGPHVIKFSSKIQHYVSVISEYGTATGTGWYDAGSTATISIRPPIEEFLIHHKFAGWEGGPIDSSEGHTATFVVDSEKTLLVKWVADFSQLVILLVIIAIIAAAAVGTIAAVKLRKKKEAKLSPTKNPTITRETLHAQQISATATSSIPSSILLQQPQIYNKQHSDTNLAAGLQQEPNENSNNGTNDYRNQLMEYVLHKSTERLEIFRNSGIISEAKFYRVKEHLEQTFH